jgi:hypothetical protein
LGEGRSRGKEPANLNREAPDADDTTPGGYVAIQSFIVKAILDRGAGPTPDAQWHGYVTHVPSGKRRSWRGLREVTEFIRERLAEVETDR